MFSHSRFTGKNSGLNDWNVSGVINMESMFEGCKLECDISNWNVSSVLNMMEMFKDSSYNKDLSTWVLNNKCNMKDMLTGCKILYKPKMLPKGFKKL